mmetsp:Transcript_133366/g.386039  ORF Transcript_133366/g.386039 Transcript_133366/m.386039 type:complete len:260 (-) Transcript_133366:2045-2824(-)
MPSSKMSLNNEAPRKFPEPHIVNAFFEASRITRPSSEHRSAATPPTELTICHTMPWHEAPPDIGRGTAAAASRARSGQRNKPTRLLPSCVLAATSTLDAASFVSLSASAWRVVLRFRCVSAKVSSTFCLRSRSLTATVRSSLRVARAATHWRCSDSSCACHCTCCASSSLRNKFRSSSRLQTFTDKSSPAPSCASGSSSIPKCRSFARNRSMVRWWRSSVASSSRRVSAKRACIIRFSSAAATSLSFNLAFSCMYPTTL